MTDTSDKNNGIMPTEIILASQSARRREILEHLGLAPKIIVSEADEHIDGILPAELYTEELSMRKLDAVRHMTDENQLVIASDTVVEKDGIIFGKPHGRQEALDMLRTLSGTGHRVVSGIAVRFGGKTRVAHEITRVVFRDIGQSELESYVSTGEPFDKAGGYGIQDKASVFVERIDGDYFNVVGLPVFRLFSMLKSDFGLDYFALLGH